LASAEPPGPGAGDGAAEEEEEEAGLDLMPALASANTCCRTRSALALINLKKQKKGW
jgi:hypothetical protein